MNQSLFDQAIQQHDRLYQCVQLGNQLSLALNLKGYRCNYFDITMNQIVLVCSYTRDFLNIELQILFLFG